MRDIPMFTTEYGVASLSLREIPYRGEAYIRVRAVQPEHVRDLLEECRQFCRMAGAERVYATWEEPLGDYPLHTVLYRMSGSVEPELAANLFPVTESTVEEWRKLLNARMAAVDCAATLTKLDEKAILSSTGAYFIHDDGVLLGLGWLEGNELKTLAAVKPGAGERVARTLLSLVEGETIHLEVASTNQRAIRLYERLGLIKTGEGCRWYEIGGK